MVMCDLYEFHIVCGIAYNRGIGIYKIGLVQ